MGSGGVQLRSNISVRRVPQSEPSGAPQSTRQAFRCADSILRARSKARFNELFYTLFYLMLVTPPFDTLLTPVSLLSPNTI